MVTQLPDGTVEFRFYRPGARHVTLAGDFNGWNTTSLPMQMDKDGWWRYVIHLTPGCYQFRYLADGEWHTDYAAFGLEHGPFGVNSVVKVEPAAASRKPAPRPPVLRFVNSRQTDEIMPAPGFSRQLDWSVDETEEELAEAFS
ncbi:MAG: isoamylase early set domain-containing protein [Phycisphaerae bacterium]